MTQNKNCRVWLSHFIMMEKKSTIIWEEIDLTDSLGDTPGAGFVITESLNDSPEKKSLKFRAEILDLKVNLKANYSDKYDFSFNPENFISTNLFGQIEFQKIENVKLPGFEFLFSETEEAKSFRYSLDKIVDFLKKDYIDEPELLDMISAYLIKIDSLDELVSIAGKFLAKNALPLRYQIFFILIGIYENNLKNIILSGEEKIILNILYKYIYLEITKNEKNLLYDYTITRENNNLLGLVFHLFRFEFKGLRNIHPIFKIIISRFDLLTEEEAVEFLNIYSKTYSYLQIYNLMKKVYKKPQIHAWLVEMKKLNGKEEGIYNQIHNDLGSPDHPNYLTEKYSLLKEMKFTYLLSPFELLLLFNSTILLELKEGLYSFYETNPYSYAANRCIAVVYFFEGDYKKFLQYLSRSGSLKLQIESLYLKAIAYKELGMLEESKKILTALYKKFPESEVLEKAIKDF